MPRPVAHTATALVVVAAGGSLAAVLPAAPAAAAQSAFTTVGEHPFTVPAGVTKVHVVAIGAKGGAGSSQYAPTPVVSFGGLATADVAVSPGKVLYVEVGGAGADGASGGTGGANGGGNGGSGGGPGKGGGGGGASDVRTLPASNGSSLASRLVVAAGGGGGGEGLNPNDVTGGDGGNAGSAGSDGGGLANPTYAGHGGGAGTTSAGGSAGGTGSCMSKPVGGDGTPGALGAGGTGGTTVANPGDFACDMAGGGGGAGMYGGGGGGSGTSGGSSADTKGGGGGGGGSNGFGSGTTHTSSAVDTTGSPRVTISWTPPTYRPDGQVKRSNDTSYVGNNVYNTTGTNQTRGWTATRGHSRAFGFRLQNDGNVADTYRVKGCASSTGFGVSWTRGSKTVTSAVTAGSYKTGRLSPGATTLLTLHVHVGTHATIGSVKSCLARTTSITRSTAVDAPRAKLTVVKG